MHETDRHLDPADAALAGALAPTGDGGLSLEDLADAAGVPLTLLEAMEREGLLVADGGYSHGDAEAVRAGLELVQGGIPLAELLDLGRRSNQAMAAIAEQAVDLFLRFVRDPVHGTTDDPQEAATRLVDAFQRMLPATERVVAHHFRQLLLAAARQRLASELRTD